jgi:hypothetical protein
MTFPHHLQLAIGRFLLLLGSCFLVYWGSTYLAFERADAQYKRHIAEIRATDPKFEEWPGHGESVRRVVTWNLDVGHAVWNELLPYLGASITCFVIAALFYLPAIVQKNAAHANPDSPRTRSQPFRSD